MLTFADRGGGVKNWQKNADVIYDSSQYLDFVFKTGGIINEAHGGFWLPPLCSGPPSQ